MPGLFLARDIDVGSKWSHTNRWEAVVRSSVRIETGHTAQSLLCFSGARYNAGANDVCRHNDF